MKLEKDIEILELNIKEAGKKMPPDTLIALKRGVKALKFAQATEQEFEAWCKMFLPGETEE